MDGSIDEASVDESIIAAELDIVVAETAIKLQSPIPQRI